MYAQEQIDELKKYCAKLAMLTEGKVEFLQMEWLSLPQGCTPRVCDALLCPVERDGYPSRLYFSTLVSCPYARNWTLARIGEKNWHVFSWRVNLQEPTLVQILVEHLTGFTRAS